MAERFIDTSRDANVLFLHAFALSRHPDKLFDPTRPEKVIKAVFSFAAKRLAKFTRAQLSAAVEYVLFGADWTVGAHGLANPVSSAPIPLSPAPVRPLPISQPPPEQSPLLEGLA